MCKMKYYYLKYIFLIRSLYDKTNTHLKNQELRMNLKINFYLKLFYKHLFLGHDAAHIFPLYPLS